MCENDTSDGIDTVTTNDSWCNVGFLLTFLLVQRLQTAVCKFCTFCTRHVRIHVTCDRYYGHVNNITAILLGDSVVGRQLAWWNEKVFNNTSPPPTQLYYRHLSNNNPNITSAKSANYQLSTNS